MEQGYRAGIIGFGYIGSVIGSVLADKGIPVVGLEKNERIVHAIQ